MDEIELKLHDMSSTLQPVDAYALVPVSYTHLTLPTTPYV